MRPMATYELRVSHRNLRWEVSCNGVTRRMIDWLCTKERAIDHAFDRAEELVRFDPHAEVVVIVAHSDGSEEKRHTVAAANERSLRAS